MSSASKHNHFDRRDEERERRDEELECLRRLVRDLELEARGRRGRRDRRERKEGSTSMRARYRAGSYQSESHQHLDCLLEYADRDLISPRD